MVPQPMDDITLHIQLSGNSRLSCISLQHTDNPPTHLIMQMVSSTPALRLGYLGTIAACKLKHRSGKPLFKALRCDRGIAFYDNFGCLFAFGDATPTSYAEKPHMQPRNPYADLVLSLHPIFRTLGQGFTHSFSFVPAPPIKRVQASLIGSRARRREVAGVAALNGIPRK
ncbi:hypothetical protein AVEN_51952-1 [Araneus ventricosus]|uniref:Uncharacterized protein n=1 Tax=Araneus ventricosus TaxID=182803 RepID=A0A4Y2NNF1_ARAVE|nr:hypothetical protein AVEN_51952-1 [Araneus ventricosus]